MNCNINNYGNHNNNINTNMLQTVTVPAFTIFYVHVEDRLR